MHTYLAVPSAAWLLPAPPRPAHRCPPRHALRKPCGLLLLLLLLQLAPLPLALLLQVLAREAAGAVVQALRPLLLPELLRPAGHRPDSPPPQPCAGRPEMHADSSCTT